MTLYKFILSVMITGTPLVLLLHPNNGNFVVLLWIPTWVKRTSISKKYFGPGGMAPSEWMRAVRAIRDTPVADYSTRGLNTTRRVAYRPPIAVSPFLLALSVSNFIRTLWR